MSIWKIIYRSIVRELHDCIGNDRPLRDYGDIFITWGIFGAIGTALYYLVFVIQGIGWISGLFGFFLVGLMTASVCVVMFYYFASWKNISDRYSQTGIWAGIAILCSGYFLMCAIAPDAQVTFAMLIVFQIVSVPTLFGPLFVPLILAEFAPGSNNGWCLLFYPSFAFAWIVKRYCENRIAHISREKEKRRKEEYQRKLRENKNKFLTIDPKTGKIATFGSVYPKANEKNNSQRH